MALTVNTNVSALNAQRSTLDSQNEMASAMERLASGKRINSARDDAAGLAIAARMENQISGLNQAVRNANDAISLVQTAEGALQETTNILQRIRELAIQSAGGAPSNADRVNLNKEVVQLQEELSRIANTTRFNGGLLLNGTFIDTDFQIGQSNNEEITVSIGDVRPERIGAYTQQTVGNVGLINKGSGLDQIDNGVKQQTLIVGVGSEVPRTVAIKQGDDARTISDKINQAGAMVNSTARTESNVYIGGHGTFTFKISSSATPDIQDVVTVGATAGSQAATLAAEINSAYSEHNISATIEVDDNGVEYVKMVQDDGYDIMVEDYVTTGDSTIDFGGDGIYEMTGAYGETAAVIGGRITIDAPESFLISSDDPSNTILQGTRASLEVVGVNNDPAAYQDASFEVTVNGVTKTINLAAPPPATPTGATNPVMELEFVATPQTQGSSGQQIGAIRAYPTTIGVIDTATTTPRGSDDLRFSLNVNGGNGGTRTDFDMAEQLSILGYETGDEVSASDFALAMQRTIDADDYFSGDNKVTVSVTESGQIQLEVANSSGSIDFAESSRIFSATEPSDTFVTGNVDPDVDTIALADHGFVTGDRVFYETAGTAESPLVDETAYFVIVVDDDTIKLASTKANALAGTAVDFNGTTPATGTETLTLQRAMSGATTAANDTVTLTAHGFNNGDIVTWTATTTADANIDTATSYYVMSADANTFKLVETTALMSDVLAETATAVDLAGSGDGTFTRNGLAERLAGVVSYADTVGTAVAGGKSREQTDTNTLVLGATVNEAFENDFGPMKPLGIENRVITENNNDTFTLAINGGSPTTVTVAAGTYYSMQELGVAVQAAIDDSPFEQNGNVPIVVTATQDENGDWGLEFASEDGYSIEVGGTRFLTSVLALSVADRSSTPDIDMLSENTIPFTAVSSEIPAASDNGSLSMAVKVNGGSFVDIDLKSYLEDAGVDASDAVITEDQFVEALQAALDDEAYFSGDNAVTVSVTDQGLVKLAVAGGDGTIAVAEHSSYRGTASGLAETLTKTVANAGASLLNNGFTAGDAYQLGSGGSITLGSAANAALDDPTDSDYVKTFGIPAVTVEADTSDQLWISFGGTEAGTLITVPAGSYFSMDEVATAVQSAIDDMDELRGTVSVSAVQHTVDDSWGLNFDSADGSQVDLWGNFFVSTELNISVGTDNDGNLTTDQLGRGDYAWTLDETQTNLSANTIRVDNHGLATGQAVLYAGNATVVGGANLNVQSAGGDGNLFAIVVDENTIQLASTAALATAGTELDLLTAGTGTQTITVASERIVIAEQGSPAYGDARYRTSVAAGAFDNGINLASDNEVTFEVIDTVTGAVHSKTVHLGSTDSSVSFDSYMSLLEAAANDAFVAEGFSFAADGGDGSYSLIMDPPGGYQVTFSGASVTEAFGGAVTASGEPSNMDGLTFESMDDVVDELNAQLAANGIAMSAVFNRGGDTFRFAVTGGPADSTSTISLNGDDLIDLGFSGSLDAIGGGTHKAEDVRYVSQIDISTREGASLAMTVVDAALETLASERGGLGAVANRLESTIANLMNISENTAASMSRVMDADFAAESTRLARAQVLQQASVAMLAQANAAAQNVLKLLQ